MARPLQGKNAPVSPQTQQWHALPAERVPVLRGSSEDGQAAAAAQRRLAEDEANEIATTVPPNPLLMILPEVRGLSLATHRRCCCDDPPGGRVAQDDPSSLATPRLLGGKRRPGAPDRTPTGSRAMCCRLTSSIANGVQRQAMSGVARA